MDLTAEQIARVLTNYKKKELEKPTIIIIQQNIKKSLS